MQEDPLLFSTFSNPSGLVSVNSTENKCIIAFPDQETGHVRIIHVSNSTVLNLESSFNEYEDQNSMVPFQAHENAIAALKLSQDGQFLVTASTRGTKIRVWNTSSCAQYSEVTRGSFGAQITDINIDVTNNFISCSSEDKGTVHVFSANEAV